jgi:hypothetical protein
VTVEILSIDFVLSDMNTRSKFLFYGGNDYQDEGGLMAHIAEETLPEFLGGTCTVIYQ